MNDSTGIGHKEILSKLTGINNWTEFEEFVRDLYSKVDGALAVTRSFKTVGKSGRKREVDVLVKFGLPPHVISLGIECKHWDKKVDGDVIDVAAAKKEDLGIDKFVVISVVGYEAGAELYARSKGIDLFIVRPSSDDDFGYTGRVVRVKLVMQGSRPVNVQANATLQTDPDQLEIGAKLLQQLFSQASTPLTQSQRSPTTMVRRFSTQPGPGGLGVVLLFGEKVGDLHEIIEHAWAERNLNFWKAGELAARHQIQFKSPSAIQVAPRIVAVINQIDFEIEYFIVEHQFEVDRGKQFPVVLENVIGGAITPVRASTDTAQVEFTMAETSQKENADYSIAPSGVVGRDGLLVTLTLTNPLDPTQHRGDSVHKLVFLEGNKAEWRRLGM